MSIKIGQLLTSVWLEQDMSASALCFSEFGWKVTCIDKDAEKIDQLCRAVQFRGPIIQQAELGFLLRCVYDGQDECKCPLPGGVSHITW